MRNRQKKVIEWVGSSLQDLRDFPAVPRQRAGFQLALLEDGDEPDDFKPMPSVKKVRGFRKFGLPVMTGLLACFMW